MCRKQDPVGPLALPDGHHGPGYGGVKEYGYPIAGWLIMEIPIYKYL